MTGANPVGRPPERIRVEVRQRVRNGTEITEDVLWPKGWPMPESGMIFKGDTLAGWIEHVELDLPAQKIVVILRP